MSKSRDHAGLQNLDHLSVAADSAGNVSRFAMSTTIATATYYAKLATIVFPATNNVAANLTLLLTPKSAAGMYSPVLVTVTALQGTSGLSSSSKVQVLSTDGAAISFDDFFLVTATAANGTDVELWVQSIIAAAYDVHVLAESFDTGVSVSAYNNGATWTATDPTAAAAASVTSDWGGTGILSSTSFSNGWAGTAYYEKDSSGRVSLHMVITTEGTTSNNTSFFTIPAGFRPGSGSPGLRGIFSSSLGPCGMATLNQTTGVVSLWGYSAGGLYIHVHFESYIARG